MGFAVSGGFAGASPSSVPSSLAFEGVPGLGFEGRGSFPTCGPICNGKVVPAFFSFVLSFG